MHDRLFSSTSARHRPGEEDRPKAYAPPAWLAFGLGLLVVVGVTVAAYLIAEMFAALGLAG